MNFRKTILSLIFIVVICLISVISIAYCSQFINPYLLRQKYETITDAKIPSNMEEVSIVYFSDLLYGNYTTTETVDKTFAMIEELDPDILIFGGDVFDHEMRPTPKMLDEIQEHFSKIKAPLGKYAVYGEMDLEDIHKEKLAQLYFNANVEVLNNQNLRIGNHSKSSIRIIGLSDEDSLDQAFSSVSDEEYNLLICHQPDLLKNEKLALLPISLALVANSHGTQLTYPLLGGYKTVKGSESINRANSRTLSFPYYITTGIGCTQLKARLNATPEVCFFILRKS
ncbi:MAG: metallophosphoesterase [Firmicutes bacterium]|nr:metallophosphoesterase [Bacillota bacterium]